MNDVVKDHRATSPSIVRCAVVTVSDSRVVETDEGGQTVVDLLVEAGHEIVVREIIPDEPDRMRKLLHEFARRADIDAILMTGGTGISSRDQTSDTVGRLLDKPLPGYGELFRMLSFAEIGAAAILSGALGGLIGRTLVLTMPGSPAAVRLAMTKIILPELGHLIREARR